ncbi:short chain dehydrogenase [Mytilinidion resinicola]|uniref:Short chain dehydrogenase n=1 Tax=Mytilinidion resinicola TaxID=574789 RepID=A0A6A6YUE7_9PEZI|nr:short chain dehydrogenase [Mytilinidion resinicola]KAF2812149.1 short chain dehydrogenase [Mytilinidion resinicola]
MAASRVLPSLACPSSSRLAVRSTALSLHQLTHLGDQTQWRPIQLNAATAFKVRYEEETTRTTIVPDISHEAFDTKRLRDFDLSGGVYIVTGGARGLGLCLAEALAEAGGKVHCLDILPHPDDAWYTAQSRAVPFGGSLHYHQVNVTDQPALEDLVARIAEDRCRLDGLIAAAGKQMVKPSLDHTVADAQWLMSINYTGVFASATAAARQMLRYKSRGSICLIASMSGLVANKGLTCPVYNSSKAAVIQLARNLAMEWGRVREDGSGGIRVNCISPGHILTPMVMADFERQPGLKELWQKENMLGRLSTPREYRGAAVFLLSRASSFMTGANLVIDGGHTAW